MEFIMQMRPWFGAEEKQALCEYMDEDGFLTEFKKTAKFEQMIADFTGAKHCIVVNNGTISLTLAALAVGINAGDEVIVPNYTMIATPNSVKMFGAKPVFVDVERETLCKAGIEAFVNLCKEHNLALIEDSAQSLGSFYPNDKHIGTMGLVGSFSFSAPKIISTGQGGALITDNDEIAAKIRKLKDFGRSGGGNDIHDSIGYNFKFTELQACVGIEQMKKLESRIVRKKEIYRLYEKGLQGIKGIELFKQDLTCTVPWFYDSICDGRDELQEFLKQNNIGSRIMYPPINKQVAYQVSGEHKVSNLIGQKGLWLPSASQLTNEQIAYICEKIAEFYKAE